MYIRAAINPLSNESYIIRLNTAAHETDPRVLDQLANDYRIAIRLNVARNEHTSANTLARLAHDTHFDVRYVAMTNPNFPKDAEQSFGQRSSVIEFGIDFTKDDGLPFDEDGFTKKITDYLENSLGYRVLLVDFIDAADYDGYDVEDFDETVYSALIRVDFAGHDYTEDDIDFVLDAIKEILVHDYGVYIDVANYYELLER